MVRPIKEASLFYKLTRRELRKREAQLRQGLQLPLEYLRGLWYKYRKMFLDENPEKSEVDIKAIDPYRKFTTNGINMWFMKNAAKLGFTRDLWFRARTSLGIESEPKTVCAIKNEPSFLVTKQTRNKVLNNISFLVTIEKKTFFEELQKEITKRGYETHVVATGGYGDSDLQELQLLVNDDQKDSEVENFYVIFLHDFDVCGIEILFTTLKKHYHATIDGGINGEFLDYLGENKPDFQRRLVEEQVVNKRYHKALEEYMDSSEDYTYEDFEYLQGEPYETFEKGRKVTHYRANRIELDSILSVYGIETFVDYLEWKIEKDCRYWDLTRIGITEKELDEGVNWYYRYISDFETKIGKVYGTKKYELGKTMNKVLQIVQNTLTLSQEFSDLEDKYLGGLVQSWSAYDPKEKTQYLFHQKEIKGVTKLKGEYIKQITKDWIEDYQDELDEEINDKLTCWEGDVRTAERKIDEKFYEIQERLWDDKKQDEHLGEFNEKLLEIEWGEEELEAIEIPDPIEEIRAVIDALEEYIAELEGQ